MNNYNNKIAITTGDYNGIGAEITVKALNELNLPSDEIVIISNPKLLKGLKNDYEIISLPADNVEYGKLSADSGEFCFQALKIACEISPRAIVTAPVSKEALHLAGHKFNGQTEVLEYFLAHNGEKAEMLFISDFFDVFLLTRHCALKSITISENMIIDKIIRLNKFYQGNTKFALCSLNPHAGEDGILGDEEIEIIIPAVKKLRDMGIDITNPLPSDTLFVDAVQNSIKGQKAPYDCYIAMYHDQGLIPVKSAAPYTTVNTTIGLPILRTSPSHGTAFNIAGQNIADARSMVSAIKTAYKLTKHQAPASL